MKEFIHKSSNLEKYSGLEDIVKDCLKLDTYKDSKILMYSFVMAVNKKLQKEGRETFSDHDPEFLKRISDILLTEGKRLDEAVFSGLLTQYESRKVIGKKTTNGFKNIGDGLNAADKE